MLTLLVLSTLVLLDLAILLLVRRRRHKRENRRDAAIIAVRMSREGRIGQGERGQAAFEFMLILPIAFAFMWLAVLILLDVGSVMGDHLTLKHATSAGAMLNAQGATVADVQQYVADETNGLVDPSQVDVCTFTAGGIDVVLVSADYHFTFQMAKMAHRSIGADLHSEASMPLVKALSAPACPP